MKQKDTRMEWQTEEGSVTSWNVTCLVWYRLWTMQETSWVKTVCLRNNVMKVWGGSVTRSWKKRRIRVQRQGSEETICLYSGGAVRCCAEEINIVHGYVKLCMRFVSGRIAQCSRSFQTHHPDVRRLLYRDQNQFDGMVVRINRTHQQHLSKLVDETNIPNGK